jgi:hypothetical protein
MSSFLQTIGRRLTAVRADVAHGDGLEDLIACFVGASMGLGFTARLSYIPCHGQDLQQGTQSSIAEVANNHVAREGAGAWRSRRGR